jgi:hypothetical protein
VVVRTPPDVSLHHPFEKPLLPKGRLRKLDDSGQIEVERRPANGGLRVRRDPRELVRLLLAASET